MVYIITGALLCAVLFGGTLIAAGVFAGVILFLALAVIYIQLPKGAKRVLVLFRLPVDFGISGVVFTMLGGGTATALLGAVTCGLLVTLALHHQVHILNDESMLVRDVRAILKHAKKL